MIVAAAIVPHPPLLIRELSGAQDAVPELRAAAHAAVRATVAGAGEVVVVGPADEPGDHDPAAGVGVRRFGPDGSPRGGLPLSLGVGVRLLADADWSGPVHATSVAWDAGRCALELLAARLTARPGRTALLLLGDGSARRGEKAPGYVDERAFRFDDALAKALEDGDATALADLDPGLADELMVLGAPAFRLLGLLGLRQPARPRTALTHREDPFGVSYLVATWVFSPSGDQ